MACTWDKKITIRDEEPRLIDVDPNQETDEDSGYEERFSRRISKVQPTNFKSLADEFRRLADEFHRLAVELKGLADEISISSAKDIRTVEKCSAQQPPQSDENTLANARSASVSPHRAPSRPLLLPVALSLSLSRSPSSSPGHRLPVAVSLSCSPAPAALPALPARQVV
ncbi:hypothetical protein ACLB2K_035076 [Fragaria x ananassa]